MFFTGNFYAHSQFWWSDGDTTEGTNIDELFTRTILSYIGANTF